MAQNKVNAAEQSKHYDTRNYLYRLTGSEDESVRSPTFEVDRESGRVTFREYHRLHRRDLRKSTD
jgi:hypothetical protein